MRWRTLVLGLTLMIVAILLQSTQNPAPKIYKPTVTETLDVLPTVTVSPTVFPDPTETMIPTATMTPMPTPKVKGYWLADKIDLASTKSTALRMAVPEGGEIRSTWAKAVAFRYQDLDCVWGGDVYCPDDPHAGVIYANQSDGGRVTVVRVHSGSLSGKWDLFGSQIDLYLRKDGGMRLTLADGEEKLKAWVRDSSLRAFLCQTDKEMYPRSEFLGECEGEELELRLVAAALITPDKTVDYDEALTGNALEWLTSQGYDQFLFVQYGSGFLLSTCVQQYPDQESIPGVEYYSFNRVALWFEVVP